MPKQLVRICRVQNLLTSSVKLIRPITELYFRQILSTDFLNRFYQDVKTGPYCVRRRGNLHIIDVRAIELQQALETGIYL